MAAIDWLSEDEITYIARNLGYDPKKPAEFKRYKTIISKMDLWDIKKTLFFGKSTFTSGSI
jgi:hypothetical protein